MHRTALLALACLCAAGQTRIDLRSQAKSVDFTAAGSTRPIKAGTALPPACAVGEMFFKTDAPPGANLYGCAPANTWSLQSGLSSQNCWYDSAGSTLKCQDAAGGTTSTVKTAPGGTANQWVDYIDPTGIPHTSQPTAAAVGAVADPGANGIPYRTGLGSATQAGAGELSAVFSCEDGGAGVNAYACDLAPAITAYRAGVTYWFKAGAANTGPATVNFNHLGARAIKKLASRDLAGDDILAGQWVMLTYDGTNMQMQSQTANPPGTLVSSVFGRTGPITAQTGDYTTAQVGESGNLYFTNARAQSAFSFPGVVRLSAGAVDCPTCLTSSTAADTDLAGTFPHLSVTRIQGRAVATAQPADQQYLGWNSNSGWWEPKTLPAQSMTSVFGRSGAVTAQSGDYSFAQISGTVAAGQLPAASMRTDQGNTVTAGTQDFSAADHTLPMRSGPAANLPATCRTGEAYFATDAPAGMNLYGCTATDTWSAQGGHITVQSEGLRVGSRSVNNYLTGPGLMSLITDTGAGIDVLWSLDTAVVQTQTGEQSGAALLCASSGGSATDYTCSLMPAAVEYTAGMVLHWKPDVNGAGGATTLNVDHLGARQVKLADGVSDPTPADIMPGRLYPVWYDGSGFRLFPTTAAATADQISSAFYCLDSGTAGAYACDLNPSLTAYTPGTIYWFNAGSANSGPATVNFNSLGPKALKKLSNQDLAANDIVAGQWVMLTYDGTNMQMLSQTAAAAAGGGSISSVFGRTGAVIAQPGDYTTAQVTESGNLYYTDERARSIATAIPAANAVPKADADGRLAGGWMPLPGAGSPGGVQAADCSAEGFVQKINTDGSITCAAGGGSGATSRTYSYFWQGAVQAGAAGFAVNLPASDAPALTSAGGTRPSAVLEWAAGQSTAYAWWSFVLPAGYPDNGAIGYKLETRSADATNAADVYLGMACSSDALDDPSIVEAPPVSVTAAASSGRTVISGVLTPNTGGLPACTAGQRLWINIRVDTAVAGRVMTQPFDVVSALFTMQGSL